MKIKRGFALLLAAALVFALPGCGKGENDKDGSSASGDGNFPAEFDTGVVEQAPDAVVSLSPALTELAFDLGYGGKLVGVSDFCTDEDGALDGLPNLGTVNAPKTDEILKLSPQVVVAVSPLTSADRKKLEKGGAAVIVLPLAEDLDGLETLYRDLGRVFGGDTDGAQAGKKLYDEQVARLEGIREQVEAAGPFEAAYLRVMPLTLATGDTFPGRMLEEAGFENSASDYTGWVYPEDKAVDLMPQVLFFDEAVGMDAVSGSIIYNTTPAYANAKCFAYDLEVFERQGVRMFDLLEQMADDAVGGSSADSGREDGDTPANPAQDEDLDTE